MFLDAVWICSNNTGDMVNEKYRTSSENAGFWLVESWTTFDLLPASRTMLPGSIKMEGHKVFLTVMQWDLYLNTSGTKHLQKLATCSPYRSVGFLLLKWHIIYCNPSTIEGDTEFVTYLKTRLPTLCATVSIILPAWIHCISILLVESVGILIKVNNLQVIPKISPKLIKIEIIQFVS